MATTVLIVDDHAGFRRAARTVLALEGFDVIAESATGSEAIEAVHASAPSSCCSTSACPTSTGSRSPCGS